MTVVYAHPTELRRALAPVDHDTVIDDLVAMPHTCATAITETLADIAELERDGYTLDILDERPCDTDPAMAYFLVRMTAPAVAVLWHSHRFPRPAHELCTAVPAMELTWFLVTADMGDEEVSTSRLVLGRDAADELSADLMARLDVLGVVGEPLGWGSSDERSVTADGSYFAGTDLRTPVREVASLMGETILPDDDFDPGSALGYLRKMVAS
jgi:hypothetical protein